MAGGGRISQLVALVVLGAGLAAAPAPPATAGSSSGLDCPAVAPADQLAAGVTPIHSFAGDDGADPWGSLNLLGSTLYGRTMAGGANGEGVIFQVGTDGSDYEVAVAFEPGKDNGQGKVPRHDNMMWDGTRFWGTALEGGQDDNGVIYTFDPASGSYAPVHAYAGAPGDGSQSHSSLVMGTGAHYALSAAGGRHDRGALLQVDPTTGAAALAYSFDTSTGDDPHGRLTIGSDGQTLYGMTRSGGKDGTGVIFSFAPASGTYTVLKHFGKADDATNGSTPDHGFLTLVGDSLWGLTTAGGTDGLGVLFRIDQDGSDFTIVHSFGAGDDDGERPHGSVTLLGDELYGTGYSGGQFGMGTVFRVGTDGSGYETIASFGGSVTGAYPKDNVTFSADGTAMFGMTIAGGANDPDCSEADGTVFSVVTPPPLTTGDPDPTTTVPTEPTTTDPGATVPSTTPPSDPTDPTPPAPDPAASPAARARAIGAAPTFTG